jgi:hypothetical protein
MAGSSTQHDSTMNARSLGVSSGKAGRTCCIAEKRIYG